MEDYEISYELSNYVNQEINSLCSDDSFAGKSNQILQKLNSLSHDQNYEEMEIYSEVSLMSLEVRNGDDTKSQKDLEQVVLCDDDNNSSLFMDERIEDPMNYGVKNEIDNEIKDSKANDSVVPELEAVNCDELNLDKSTDDSSKKNKTKAPRDVKPVNFTSLKRKDVIFKSILRMMRRFF